MAKKSETSKNKSFLRCAAMALLSMTIFLAISFRHAFRLMGEHHDTHVARKVEDHPVMMSHKIGTEPLQVSV